MKTLFLFLLAFLAGQSIAYSQHKPVSIYYMPDGKPLKKSQVDSVLGSWGPRAAIKKESYGTDSVVIHLVKQTEDEMKAAIAAREQETNAMKALLHHQAPDFTLQDLSGKNFHLKAFRGRVVVLNFWFTTCLPCIAEMPNLNRIKHRFQHSTVLFLGLSFNKPEEIKVFLREHTFDFTPLAETKSVDKRYHITGYPTTLVIDKAGVVRFIKMGGENISDELKSAILKANSA